jgi:DNA-binding LytR/AlgR family response regulator
MMGQLRPDSECVAEAGDDREGLALLEQTQLDLLFLDIEFPARGGFNLLRQARSRSLPLPPIIFVTGFDHYAVEAFRWEAWDYLLKPLDRERLEDALGRVEARILMEQNMEALLAALARAEQHAPPERLVVQVKDHFRVVALADISHVTAENRLVFIHSPGGRLLLDRTLNEMEATLGSRFFRCHRSALVALDQIHELVPRGVPGPQVVLKDGSIVPVAKERWSSLTRVLG